MKTKTFFSLIILIFAFSQILIAKEIKSVEEKTFPMKFGGSVTVVGDEGNITVKAWDKEEVYLKITRRVWERNERKAEELMAELEVDIRHSGNRLFVKEVDLHDRHNFRFSDIFNRDKWNRNYQIDYELTVPKEIDLKIENDEGDVDVTGIAGRLKLNIDEGNLFLQDLGAVQADIQIDEGDLECRNVQGSTSTFYVHVDEGAVRFTECQFAEFEVKSDEGDVVLTKLTVKDCDLDSDEGDIEADIKILPEGRCRMQTDEGDILIRLPEVPNLKIRAETAEGRIRSDFDVSIRSWGDDGEKMDAVLGQNLARLDVYADEGNIIIKRK